MASPQRSPQMPTRSSLAPARAPLCKSLENSGRIANWRLLPGLTACLIVSLAGGCRFAANGQNAMGTQLYEQGQYTAALQQFQKALASDPKNADAFYNLAATTHRLGVQRKEPDLNDQAEALYNQCLDVAPNHVECHRALAVLLADTGRPDRAFALMKNWAAKNPLSAEPRIELARLYEEANDPTQAIKNLEDAVQTDPNSARAWLALGQLRQTSGDLIQARQNFERSLALNSQQPFLSDRIAAVNRAISANYNATLANGGTQIAAPPDINNGFIRR